jgi:hypothetical protein
MMDDPPQLVSELICAMTRTWIVEKLELCFMPIDAKVIMGILLCIRSASEFWSGHYEKIGGFTVRSAYMMLVATKQ